MKKIILGIVLFVLFGTFVFAEFSFKNKSLIFEKYSESKKELLKSVKFKNYIENIDNILNSFSNEKLEKISLTLKNINENDKKFKNIKDLIIYIKLKVKIELINIEITNKKIIPKFIKEHNYLKIENKNLYCEFGDKNNKSPKYGGYYYSKQKINIIKNPYLLEVLNENLVKDNKFIYNYSSFCTTGIPGSCSCFFEKTDLDLNSFELLNDYFYKDKNNLYYLGFKIKGIDLDTFDFLKDDKGEISYYIKDKNNVFYLENKILGVDIDSFIVLKGFFVGKKYDAKDKNNYYYYGKKIVISFNDIKFEAIKKNNILFCENLKNNEDIKKCKKNTASSLFYKAIQKNNLELCNSTFKVELCKDKVNYNLALKNKNISFCKEIKGENKDKCFLKLYNIGGCDYIIEEDTKSRCLKYEESTKLKEIYNKAVNENSFEQCILVYKNKRLFEECQRTILQNAKTKYDCMRIYEVGSKEYGKMCYSNLSLSKKDITICKEMNNKYDSDRCIEHYKLFIKIRNGK